MLRVIESGRVRKEVDKRERGRESDFLWRERDKCGLCAQWLET